jgi:hypothetical protein|tara:strand:+ start:2715 stop:3071 length:357 start_codon:yes stop_codon:yes gene_type:complete
MNKKKITEIVHFILDIENIHTSEDLEQWQQNKNKMLGYVTCILSEPTVQIATQYILDNENIKHKDDLIYWCGLLKKHKLYNYIGFMASKHCKVLTDYRAAIRGYYQQKITGYKQFKHT